MTASPDPEHRLPVEHRTHDDGMTIDEILTFCAAPTGLLDMEDLFEPATRRTLAQLVRAGRIERRERTYGFDEHPEMVARRAHAAWLGPDLYERRSVTIGRYHLVPGATP